MHDGVRLAADLFLPEGGGRWPTVLVRTPYGRKSTASQSYRYFVRRGYALLIEDVRGRYASQGRFGDMECDCPGEKPVIGFRENRADEMFVLAVREFRRGGEPLAYVGHLAFQIELVDRRLEDRPANATAIGLL